MSKPRYYLAAMNDAYFVIDQPPRPSSDDGPAARVDGPNVIEACGANREYAERRCAELNAA